MEQTISKAAVKAIRTTQIVIVVLVAAVSLAVLFGNAMHIDMLRNFTPWGGAAKTNTGICLLSMTIAFCLMLNGGDRSKSTAIGLSVLSLAISLLTLIEWCTGWNVGIDNFIFPELVLDKDSLVLGRMPTNSALAVSLLALSVITGVKSQNKQLSQLLSFAAFSIGLLSVAGHTFEVEGLLKIGQSTLISFPSALSIMLLSGAVFAAYPESGFARILSSTGRGGYLARTFLPLSALFPLVGFATILTGVPGSSDTGMVLVLLNCMSVPIAIWGVATALEKADLARAEALNASLKKSEFLSTMSHEIRTPMTGVIGMTDLLLKTGLNEEQRRYAMRIKESGAALLTVINEILDLSKIEAEKITLAQEAFDLAETIIGVVDLLTPKATANSVQLVTNVEHGIPHLLGDRGRVRQIIVNLLANALKFSPHCHVEISAFVQSQDRDSALIRIAVADTGPGIAREKLTNLFQPFSQVTFAPSGESTGLGLSISKKLVDAMGGKIGVESEVGKGSMFWVEIPFPIATESEQAILSPGEPVLALTTEHRPEVILVVEDHEVNRELAVLLLAQGGFDSHVAVNGAEAVEMIKRFDYAAALMDCQMPVLDGFSATRAIREWEKGTNRHLPIIAMTAGAIEGSAEQCIAAGMDDFISKPVDTEKFRAVFEKWLPKPAIDDDASPPQTRFVDLNRLFHSLGRDSAQRLFQIFAEDAEAEIKTIHELWSAKDTDGLLSAVHGLKGDCAAVGATALRILCADIEDATKSCQWDQAKNLIDAMDGCYSATINYFHDAENCPN